MGVRKLCLLCKGYHRVNEHHSRKDYLRTINRLKEKKNMEFFSSCEINYINEIIPGDCSPNEEGGGDDVTSDTEEEGNKS